MFPMTVTISNPAQLNAVMAALDVGGLESPKTTPCAGHVPETAKEEVLEKKTTPAEKAEPAPTQRTAEAATAAVQEQKAEPSAQAAAPNYQDTADAVTKLARAKGREAAVAVLTKFGASRLPDIQPHDFQKVIDLVNVALGA